MKRFNLEFACNLYALIYKIDHIRATRAKGRTGVDGSSILLDHSVEVDLPEGWERLIEDFNTKAEAEDGSARLVGGGL